MTATLWNKLIRGLTRPWSIQYPFPSMLSLPLEGYGTRQAKLIGCSRWDGWATDWLFCWYHKKHFQLAVQLPFAQLSPAHLLVNGFTPKNLSPESFQPQRIRLRNNKCRHSSIVGDQSWLKNHSVQPLSSPWMTDARCPLDVWRAEEHVGGPFATKVFSHLPDHGLAIPATQDPRVGGGPWVGSKF